MYFSLVDDIIRGVSASLCRQDGVLTSMPASVAYIRPSPEAVCDCMSSVCTHPLLPLSLLLLTPAPNRCTHPRVRVHTQ